MSKKSKVIAFFYICSICSLPFFLVATLLMLLGSPRSSSRIACMGKNLLDRTMAHRNKLVNNYIDRIIVDFGD